MTPRSTGRKPTYSPEQLDEALRRAEQEAAAPTAADVARQLTALTGKAPNMPVLERNLEDLRVARARQTEDGLIAALPADVVDAAEQESARLLRAIKLGIARGHDALVRQSEAREADRDRLQQTLLLRQRELEAENEDLKGRIAAGQTALDAANEAVARLESELAEARATIRDRSLQDEVVETLAERLMARLEPGTTPSEQPGHGPAPSDDHAA